MNAEPVKHEATMDACDRVMRRRYAERTTVALDILELRDRMPSARSGDAISVSINWLATSTTTPPRQAYADAGAAAAGSSDSLARAMRLFLRAAVFFFSTPLPVCGEERA